MGAMFTRRTSWDLSPNELTRAWEAVLLSAPATPPEESPGSSLRAYDLTASNPTHCGFRYPREEILRLLSDSRSLVYAPEPAGLASAREAVAAELSEGARRPVGPESIVLTASTSEAYGWLLKLLCERGDRVLVPRPSYPLLDHLANLEDVELVSYGLRYHDRGRFDLERIREGLAAGARAVLVVNPNNPTGTLVHEEDARALRRLCAEHGAAIISDEVFLDYCDPPHGDGLHPGRLPKERPTGEAPRPRLRSMAEAGLDMGGPSAGGEGRADTPEALTFVLGGLSKSAGLPQIKVGWIHVAGPMDLVREASARLEMIADTYLSVNTPAQCALPELLHLAPAIRRQIHARTAGNRRWLQGQRNPLSSWDLVPAEGGWYAVLRVPRIMTEERWCLALATEDRLLVHPGYFFDFDTEAFLVVSTLLPEADFRDALGRLIRRIDAVR